MKFVILIHSNPQPWGHPTGDFIAENRNVPKEQLEQMNAEFGSMLSQLEASGELLTSGALGDPATSKLYRWEDGTPIATDGPYAESKEQFAGFFVIDVPTRDRAEQVAASFSGPGETIELRPLMSPGADDA
jgi:hypothetical protein